MLKYVIRSIGYRIYIRWLALKWIKQINLGDEVWHRGRKRHVINWAGQPQMTLSDPYEEYVPSAEIRKVRSIANAWHSYRSGVRFYTGSWLGIWTRSGIEPWVRALQIWPRRTTS
jgi:hypothetical protein